MRQYEFAQAALADLSAITDYTTSRWGKARARAYLDALESLLRELAERPRMGRRRDELADGLLCFPFESHVVFYLQADFGITVVRVLHKRQDPLRHKI